MVTHRQFASSRRLCVSGAVGVVLALGLVGGASAQGEALCANPRSFCAAAEPPQCAAQLNIEDPDAAIDPVCVAAVKSYRTCLREAADCPGVVDQKTPRPPKDANATCGSGDCPEKADAVAPKDPPKAPPPPKEPK